MVNKKLVFFIITLSFLVNHSLNSIYLIAGFENPHRYKIFFLWIKIFSGIVRKIYNNLIYKDYLKLKNK